MPLGVKTTSRKVKITSRKSSGQVKVGARILSIADPKRSVIEVRMELNFLYDFSLLMV